MRLDETNQNALLQKVRNGQFRSNIRKQRSLGKAVLVMHIIKTNIDQQAATLGAAAIAAVGTGLWSDFEQVDRVHKVTEIVKPIAKNNCIYEQLLLISKKAGDFHSELGDDLAKLRE